MALFAYSSCCELAGEIKSDSVSYKDMFLHLSNSYTYSSLITFVQFMLYMAWKEQMDKQRAFQGQENTSMAVSCACQ